MINVNDIPAVRALVEQQAGASSSGDAAAASAPAQNVGSMVQAASLPAVRALLEQDGPPAAPQYARAPAGNGHEVALKQGGWSR